MPWIALDCAVSGRFIVSLGKIFRSKGTLDERARIIRNEPPYITDDETSSGKSVLRIASVAALRGFLFGYDSAVINGAVSAIGDQFEINGAVLGSPSRRRYWVRRVARCLPGGSPTDSDGCSR